MHDTTHHPAAPAPMSHREILVVFGALMSGMLLAALDQTIVSTALPTIVGELGGLDHLSWVVTAYLLTSTASTPLYGKISDLYGRKVVFQTAIAIFVGGSILAGLSQNMMQLILFRGIQGVGGGGLMAMAFAIIGDVVSPRERGRYTGYLGAVFAVSSVAGPLIGGFLVDSVSWRWVFYVNVPIGIAATYVTARHLHLPVRRQEHRIDYEGAALFVAAVTCLLLVTVWGGSEYAWSSPTIIGLGAAGVVLALSFVAWERRAAEPILPLRLFRNSIFTTSSLALFVTGCGMFAGIIYLPLFLQVVTGASATNSGLLLLPLMAGLMTTSVGSGRVIARTGRYKRWPAAGMAIASVGMLLLSTMDRSTGRLESSAYMVVLGLGLGMVMQVLILAVQNAADPRDMGVATSATSFFRSMGASFGVAVFGAILNARITSELPGLLPPGAPAALRDDPTALLNSPAQIRALPVSIGDAVIEAVAGSLDTVFLWAVPVLVVGFVLTMLVKEIPLRTTSNVASAEHAPL